MSTLVDIAVVYGLPIGLFLVAIRIDHRIPNVDRSTFQGMWVALDARRRSEMYAVGGLAILVAIAAVRPVDPFATALLLLTGALLMRYVWSLALTMKVGHELNARCVEHGWTPASRALA